MIKGEIDLFPFNVKELKIGKKREKIDTLQLMTPLLCIRFRIYIRDAVFFFVQDEDVGSLILE